MSKSSRVYNSEVTFQFQFSICFFIYYQWLCVYIYCLLRTYIKFEVITPSVTKKCLWSSLKEVLVKSKRNHNKVSWFIHVKSKGWFECSVEKASFVVLLFQDRAWFDRRTLWNRRGRHIRINRSSPGRQRKVSLVQFTTKSLLGRGCTHLAFKRIFAWRSQFAAKDILGGGLTKPSNRLVRTWAYQALQDEWKLR